MLFLISTIALPPSGHLIRAKSSAFLSVRCVNSPARGYGGSCFVYRLCVRQEYFDGPELDRLILDAWSNVLGFASPGEAAPYQKQITRDVVLDSRSPDCEERLKELIWAFSDFARDRRGVHDPEARCLAGNPWYPVAGQL